MKRKIRLTESELRNVIAKSVRNMLNEMGTPKQNAFLRKLMGDRYKPEYDNLSVPDSSAMIDKELQAQKAQQSTSNATPKQINFIQSNNYFPIPEIVNVADKLTQEDAKTLVSVLNPYTNGFYTYYGHARQRKEYWLPQVKEIVVPILEKYGLNDAAQRVSDFVDNFMNKHNAKLEKEKQKKLKAEEERLRARMEQLKNDPNTLILASTKDEENRISENLPREFYMDGILEEKMGWDICGIMPQSNIKKEYFDDKLMNEIAKSYGQYMTIPTYVAGYERPCTTVVWIGVGFMHNLELTGRIVDDNDCFDAIKFAKANSFKPHSGDRISK